MDGRQHSKQYFKNLGLAECEELGTHKPDLITKNKSDRAEKNWKARAFHDRAHLAAMERWTATAMRANAIDFKERIRQVTEQGLLAANIVRGSHGYPYE